MPSHSQEARVHYACARGDEATQQTAGLLFFRDNPRDPSKTNDAPRWKLTERDGSLSKAQSNWRTDGGDPYEPRKPDLCFDLPDWHPFKRRIPHTSIVNRVGDWSCGFGGRFTAAQVIFWLNAMALVLNVVLCFLIWVFTSLDSRGPDDLHLQVYRIASINYTSNSTDPLILVESTEVQVSTWMIIILAIDAALYLLMVCCLPFERWWFYLARQIDDAFVWWRWVVWSISDSLTVVLIAMIVGLREQFLLTTLGVCIWICMIMGFSTELWSRPRYYEDQTDYKWRIGNRNCPLDFETKQIQYRTWDGQTKLKTVPDFTRRRLLPGAPPPILDGKEWPGKGWGFWGKEDYENNPMAMKLISQEAWEGDRPLFDYNDPNTRYYDGSDEYVFSQRFSNYIRRMLPWGIGLVPGVVAWSIIGINWFYRQYDLRNQAHDQEANFSEANTLLVMGAATIHAFKALILPIWQKQSPSFFYGSELFAIPINAFFKAWVAIFLIVNVIHGEGESVEAILATYH
jgi:hypothetical protein